MKIWQYWETKKNSFKPAYIDLAFESVKKNSDVEVVLVTPENLNQFLPDLNPKILKIQELAHKSDLIRTRLIHKYGGFWLDSDAVVIKSLKELFDYLEGYEFVGFPPEDNIIRINCFGAKPNSKILKEWIDLQEQILEEKTEFNWDEVGSKPLTKSINKNNQKNIKLIEDLAGAIGGTLACSRPIVDKKWLPKSRQVGTSGKTVKPKLYLAIGISGTFQHLAGIKGADTVVAINKDPKAPFFNVADYGIVEDLFKVVPALTEKIEEGKKE